MLSHGDLVGIAFLATYLLCFLLFGTLSHRIRFIGTNAHVRSGYVWARAYHSLVFAFVVLGIFLLIILQTFVNIDQCMADSVHLYTDHTAHLAWEYSRTFASLLVALLCCQICFVQRIGSRIGSSGRRGTQWSYNMNWEAICQVCMFHVGCRSTYFLCVAVKALLRDGTCYPIGGQLNSVSFDAQYAAFWLLTLMRLPVSLSSQNPEAVDTNSLATYVARACQGHISTPEVFFLVSSLSFVLSQFVVVVYYDFGRGRHSLRQIYYGLLLGSLGHLGASINVSQLFQNTPQANMPTSRNVRMQRLLVPLTQAALGYFILGALGYRLLRDKHKTMMWSEILNVKTLFGDLLIALIFIFGLVRRGARRQGYVRYDAVLPQTDLSVGN